MTCDMSLGLTQDRYERHTGLQKSAWRACQMEENFATDTLLPRELQVGATIASGDAIIDLN